MSHSSDNRSLPWWWTLDSYKVDLESVNQFPKACYNYFNRCPCSCGLAHDKRWLRCCHEVATANNGKANGIHCAQYCSHKWIDRASGKKYRRVLSIFLQLVEPEVLACSHLLKYQTYCVAEGGEVVDCCRRAGVPSDCLYAIAYDLVDGVLPAVHTA